MGLLEVAVTGGAVQLPPRATARMPVGTDIAQPHPAPIGTGRLRAKMRRRVHLARAATRGDDAGWWATGRLGDVLVGLGTGVAVRLGGEARKGCGRTVALGPWGGGLACRRARGSGVAGPRPLEHDTQPRQGDQHQLVEKEMGDRGKTPSYRWRNEGILPNLSGHRISRRLQVHDPYRTSRTHSHNP